MQATPVKQRFREVQAKAEMSSDERTRFSPERPGELVYGAFKSGYEKEVLDQRGGRQRPRLSKERRRSGNTVIAREGSPQKTTVTQLGVTQSDETGQDKSKGSHHVWSRDVEIDRLYNHATGDINGQALSIEEKRTGLMKEIRRRERKQIFARNRQRFAYENGPAHGLLAELPREQPGETRKRQADQPFNGHALSIEETRKGLMKRVRRREREEIFARNRQKFAYEIGYRKGFLAKHAKGKTAAYPGGKAEHEINGEKDGTREREQITAKPLGPNNYMTLCRRLQELVELRPGYRKMYLDYIKGNWPSSLIKVIDKEGIDGCAAVIEELGKQKNAEVGSKALAAGGGTLAGLKANEINVLRITGRMPRPTGLKGGSRRGRSGNGIPNYNGLTDAEFDRMIEEHNRGNDRQARERRGGQGGQGGAFTEADNFMASFAQEGEDGTPNRTRPDDAQYASRAFEVREGLEGGARDRISEFFGKQVEEYEDITAHSSELRNQERDDGRQLWASTMIQTPATVAESVRFAAPDDGTRMGAKGVVIKGIRKRPGIETRIDDDVETKPTHTWGVWRELQALGLTKTGRESSRHGVSPYKRLHLLNGNIYGPGDVGHNLAPGSTKMNNDHKTRVEQRITENIEEGHVVDYSVTAVYNEALQGIANARVPRAMRAELAAYVRSRNNFYYKQDPDGEPPTAQLWVEIHEANKENGQGRVPGLIVAEAAGDGVRFSKDPAATEQQMVGDGDAEESNAGQTYAGTLKRLECYWHAYETESGEEATRASGHMNIVEKAEQEAAFRSSAEEEGLELDARADKRGTAWKLEIARVGW